MTTTLSPALMEQSIAYAENNFINDNAKHLHVDKDFIRKNFDLNGKNILDFGSGMGGMSLWYAQNWDCTVHGVDIDGQHVSIANHLKMKHKLDNVQFEKRDITSQKLPPPYHGSFDLVFMNDVAEHIPYPVLDEIFKELHRLLSPKGRIFVSYPPWQSPYASHVTRVTKLPWCQFLPEKVLLKWIEKKNMVISGERESDLVEAYKGLNHLTHERLMGVTGKAGFKVASRLSHSLLRKLPILRGVNPNIVPLHFLISKEIVILEKA
jgi:2-polyprenyl-3-methyl-5-hydroxy-6-metoxy-1,4-benzoquinol methylase